MHVIEIFLPLQTGDGSPVSKARIDCLVADLAQRFGGATAFTRAPADGLWKDRNDLEHDRIAILEVMVENLDTRWWSDFRTRLEHEFQQSEVLIRATAAQKI